MNNKGDLMKALIKKTIHRFGLTFLILVTVFIWGAGCVAPKADPLTGWRDLRRRDSEKLDQAIKDDYRDYIQKLLSKKTYFIDESNIAFYEDGTGQHAVRIEIPSNGTWREHVLIYDRDNKRIKVIRYTGGSYRS
jgi:hypothetical protein